MNWCLCSLAGKFLLTDYFLLISFFFWKISSENGWIMCRIILQSYIDVFKHFIEMTLVSGLLSLQHSGPPVRVYAFLRVCVCPPCDVYFDIIEGFFTLPAGISSHRAGHPWPQPWAPSGGWHEWATGSGGTACSGKCLEMLQSANCCLSRSNIPFHSF